MAFPLGCVAGEKGRERVRSSGASHARLSPLPPLRTPAPLILTSLPFYDLLRRLFPHKEKSHYPKSSQNRNIYPSYSISQILGFIYELHLIAMFIIETSNMLFSRSADYYQPSERHLCPLWGKCDFLLCWFGRSRAHVTWLKDSETVRPSKRVAINDQMRSLQLFMVTVAGAGKYTCVYKNKHGEDRHWH